ncbi:dipicolinate synthase [Rummeliibacillus suwonensis]|uniref:dipicolinate synthase n=1 Tax=Rummeliibacillus suwonensis TaxID=1306154 RepID=UPI001AAF40B6|nr:dipicolinate synthase [Rummeliibacillus suwonensis]MBO2534625.1 dipicolinate synthase [Rummeliibacillus suwonensis]
MSKETWLILGKDLRFKELALRLSLDFENVIYKYTDNWNEEVQQIIVTEKPQRIVLPIHAVDLPKSAFESLSDDTAIFVGKSNQSLQQELRSLKEDHVIYYLQDESYIWLNARLTSEGMLCAFYELESASVYGKSFYITGFGRVAKMLAYMLHKLGANVHILARSNSQIQEAIAYGYVASQLIPKNIKESYYLINTIPNKWLTDEFYQLLDQETKIFDVASAPGCLNVKSNEQLSYYLLPGLPGKYFPQDAADLLAQIIIRKNNELGEE